MNEAHIADFQPPPFRPRTRREGLTFTRRFSQEGVSPYDEVQWERRTASITDTKGNSIFEQKDVEVPVDWSMTATNIVASKYLHGQIGHAGAGDRGAATGGARGGDDARLGHGGRLLCHARGCDRSSTTSWRTCC